jgi:hypothetical protein
VPGCQVGPDKVTLYSNSTSQARSQRNWADACICQPLKMHWISQFFVPQLQDASRGVAFHVLTTHIPSCTPLQQTHSQHQPTGKCRPCEEHHRACASAHNAAW